MLCSMYLLSAESTWQGAKRQESVLLRYDLGKTKAGWIPYSAKCPNGLNLGIFEESPYIQEADCIEFEAVHFPPKRARKPYLDWLS